MHTLPVTPAQAAFEPGQRPVDAGRNDEFSRYLGRTDDGARRTHAHRDDAEPRRETDRRNSVGRHDGRDRDVSGHGRTDRNDRSEHGRPTGDDAARKGAQHEGASNAGAAPTKDPSPTDSDGASDVPNSTARSDAPDIPSDVADDTPQAVAPDMGRPILIDSRVAASPSADAPENGSSISAPVATDQSPSILPGQSAHVVAPSQPQAAGSVVPEFVTGEAASKSAGKTANVTATTGTPAAPVAPAEAHVVTSGIPIPGLTGAGAAEPVEGTAATPQSAAEAEQPVAVQISSVQPRPTRAGEPLSADAPAEPGAADSVEDGDADGDPQTRTRHQGANAAANPAAEDAKPQQSAQGRPAGGITPAATDAAGEPAPRAEGAQTRPLDAKPATAASAHAQSSFSAPSFANELRQAADLTPRADNAAARTVPQPTTQQVAVQISRAIDAGRERLEINLKPAELGRVSVKLEVGHDHRVYAVIQAERPETLDLLQRDARALERALAETGLRADSGSLSFGMHGQGTDGAPNEGSGGRGHTMAVHLPDEDVGEGSTHVYAAALDADGIDIHV